MATGARAQLPDSSRAEILGAAAGCFTESGYAATSIDDVARSIGATKGMIYHHFQSKADLFAEVFRAGMDMNYAAVQPLASLPGRAVDRWRRMAWAHTLMMIETRTFQRVVWMGVEMHLRGATTPEQRQVFNELIEYRTQYGVMFRKEMLAAKADGDFAFEDISIANQVMFMCLNSPIFWFKSRTGETAADREAVVAQIVDYAQAGLSNTHRGGRR